MNPQMFNSFLDGTKSGIEMAAIANATGLAPPSDGLGFPPCGTHDLPLVLRPREAGGVLTAPLPGRSSGGRGAPRLAPASEAALRRIAEESYLADGAPG